MIDLLFDGATQKAIGRQLGLNDRTVRRHLDELKAKLNAANSLQIPLYATLAAGGSPNRACNLTVSACAPGRVRDAL